ncbi:MAG: FtsX-like permease family protein, partial [Coprobacillus sp.]|nr:FtsX-like permease family protein [Coprobacillus sp.]
VGSSSLTLDIKNKGLAAFDELIGIVKLRKSGIILFYNNEEIKVVYDNVFEIIDQIYCENEASIISISYSFINEENIHIEPSYSQTIGRFLTAYSARNFNNKIGRSVISFILILLISAFTLFDGNFTFYNYGKEMEKALQSENIPYTSLYYGDTYYGTGYSDGYLLHYYTSDDDNYYPTYLSQIRTLTHISNFYIVLVKDDTFDFLGTEYKVPTDGSVMVTDTLEFLCEALEVSTSPYSIKISSLSTTEYDFYLPLTFSDNYISTPLGSDFKSGVSFNDLSEYSYGFISYDAFVSQFKEEVRESGFPSLYFKTNNILYEYNNNSYSSSFIKTNDESPQIGRGISNENDIIVSKSLFPNYSDSELLNLIDHKILIKDMASLSYEESHLDKFDFNMYDYTQTLTIVGITDDDKDSIIVSEKLYDDILGSIPYTMYSDICSTKCARRLNKLYKQEIQADEYPVFLITDFYEESVKTASTIYLIIGATLLVLFIVMVFLTASSLIKDKYREIAIMKSLGLKNTAIFISFFLTLVIPLLVGTGIGIAIGSVINVILNIAFVNPSSYLYVEYEFSTYMLRFSVWSFVVPIVLCVAIALIAAFFFVRRITNKRTFGALKEFRE